MSSEALERATAKLRLRDSLGGAAPALLTPEEADALLAEVARLEQERDWNYKMRGEALREAVVAQERADWLGAALAVAREREQRERRHHTVALDVAEFHQALDIPIGDTPAIRRPELRAELIREEAKEAVAAIERGDLIEALDGLCDLLCVTYGAALEFGVNLAPIWDEVHRTNMAKAGGPVRADGKRLKPEGWTPPDIGAALARAALVDEPAAAEPLHIGYTTQASGAQRGDVDPAYAEPAAATLAEPGFAESKGRSLSQNAPGSASAAADEPATCPEQGTAFRTSCEKCVEAVEREGGARDQARARWESAGEPDDAMANAELMRGFWIDAAADEPGETPA